MNYIEAAGSQGLQGPQVLRARQPVQTRSGAERSRGWPRPVSPLGLPPGLGLRT